MYMFEVSRGARRFTLNADAVSVVRKAPDGRAAFFMRRGAGIPFFVDQSYEEVRDMLIDANIGAPEPE